MSYSLTSSNISAITAAITNNGMLSLPTSSGTYTITTTGYGSGNGNYASASSWGITSSTNTDMYNNRDIVIRRENGKDIRVGDTLEQLMDLFMFIPKDGELLGKNPALKDAYDHHQNVMREVFSNSKLKESFESYHTIRRLVTEETENG